MVNAQKESLLYFGREQDLKGERGKSTYWCMPIVLSFFFPLFSLFFPLFSLLSFFFYFSCFLLFSFFLLREYPLFFDPLFRAWQGSFYSACRNQCFTTLPLNCLCLVWAYLPTTKGSFVCHSPLPDKGRFVSFVSPP